MDIVTIHNLKKYFGNGENQVKALDGIDLSIEKGKFTAIIGASGSGKTTLLRDLKDGLIALHEVHWLNNLYRESVGVIMQVIMMASSGRCPAREFPTCGTRPRTIDILF